MRLCMAILHIPRSLLEWTQGVERISVAGETLRQALTELEARFPGIRAQLAHDDGLLPGVAVSIDGAFSSRGLLAKIGPESEIHFLPAIGGG